MGKLVDDVEKMDIPNKDKLMITMFPGIGFGFLPPNFKELVERLDCESCLQICVRIKAILEKGDQQKAAMRWWQSLPFFRSRAERAFEQETEPLLKEANALRDADTAHWSNETEKEISREFVGCYLQRENWEHSTGAGMSLLTQKK